MSVAGLRTYINTDMSVDYDIWNLINSAGKQHKQVVAKLSYLRFFAAPPMFEIQFFIHFLYEYSKIKLAFKISKL